eukprot:10040810-Prorocentrum_lima.AAC.1
MWSAGPEVEEETRSVSQRMARDACRDIGSAGVHDGGHSRHVPRPWRCEGGPDCRPPPRPPPCRKPRPNRLRRRCATTMSRPRHVHIYVSRRRSDVTSLHCSDLLPRRVPRKVCRQLEEAIDVWEVGGVETL